MPYDKFGSLVPQGWRYEFAGWQKPEKEFDAIKTVILERERLGYDSIWIYDHFITYPEATDPCFESWTALRAPASITKKLGLGTNPRVCRHWVYVLYVAVP